MLQKKCWVLLSIAYPTHNFVVTPNKPKSGLTFSKSVERCTQTFTQIYKKNIEQACQLMHLDKHILFSRPKHATFQTLHPGLLYTHVFLTVVV